MPTEHMLIWDQIFVRCRRTTVNALVVNVPAWAMWCPGTTVRTITVDDYRLGFTPPRRFATGLRHGQPSQCLQLHVDRVRPRDKGLEFSVRGDVTGTGEWFHLDQPHGVVVNYLLRATLAGATSSRWVSAHRRAIRAGMNSLKQRLEAGRLPGAEPHPQLVAHQARELTIYASEVAAHDSEQDVGHDNGHDAGYDNQVSPGGAR